MVVMMTTTMKSVRFPFLNCDHIGELPCDHLFHVECLKMWLPRKNVCPLCQTKEVAMPRYDEGLESTDLSSPYYLLLFSQRLR
jgi:hypothetical protein